MPLGNRATVPSFPIETLPDYMASMALAVATEMQVPVDLPASLGMGVLSTAAGGRAEAVVRGQWREPLNVYQVCAMPPGSGKSPVFGFMCAPVYAAEEELREAAREDIIAAGIARETAIAIAEAARRKAKGDADVAAAVRDVSLAAAMPIPVMPRLTADDITPEQVATIMAEKGEGWPSSPPKERSSR